MVIEGSLLNVVDNTGVLVVKCIKILGKSYKTKAAGIGDFVLVTVVYYSTKKGFFLDKKKKDRFRKGKKFIALVIRTKFGFLRDYGAKFYFSDNSVILVNKRKVPLGNFVKGPILMELVGRYNSLGSMVTNVI